MVELTGTFSGTFLCILIMQNAEEVISDKTFQLIVSWPFKNLLISKNCSKIF